MVWIISIQLKNLRRTLEVQNGNVSYMSCRTCRVIQKTPGYDLRKKCGCMCSRLWSDVLVYMTCFNAYFTPEKKHEKKCDFCCETGCDFTQDTQSTPVEHTVFTFWNFEIFNCVLILFDQKCAFRGTGWSHPSSVGVQYVADLSGLQARHLRR